MLNWTHYYKAYFGVITLKRSVTPYKLTRATLHFSVITPNKLYKIGSRYKSGKEMPADFLSRNVLGNIHVFTAD